MGVHGQRPLFHMGAAPTLTIYNAIVREESLCGWPSTGEHVLPDRLTANFACGDSSFLIPFIRVRPPQKRVCAL